MRRVGFSAPLGRKLSASAFAPPDISHPAPFVCFHSPVGLPSTSTTPCAEYVPELAAMMVVPLTLPAYARTAGESGGKPDDSIVRPSMLQPPLGGPELLSEQF